MASLSSANSRDIRAAYDTNRNSPRKKNVQHIKQRGAIQQPIAEDKPCGFGLHFRLHVAYLALFVGCYIF